MILAPGSGWGVWQGMLAGALALKGLIDILRLCAMEREEQGGSSVQQRLFPSAESD